MILFYPLPILRWEFRGLGKKSYYYHAILLRGGESLNFKGIRGEILDCTTIFKQSFKITNLLFFQYWFVII